MDKQLKGKILVLGPKRCGKTRIANFLSGFDENPNFDVYKPTAGTRILECERIAKAGKTSINMQARRLSNSSMCGIHLFLSHHSAIDNRSSCGIARATGDMRTVGLQF